MNQLNSVYFANIIHTKLKMSHVKVVRILVTGKERSKTMILYWCSRCKRHCMHASKPPDVFEMCGLERVCRWLKYLEKEQNDETNNV